jgi:hypothetical protein
MISVVFKLFFTTLLIFHFINANVHKTKRLKHKNHQHENTINSDYDVIGAHAQILINQMNPYPNVRSTTQSPMINGNKQLPPNFRQAPRVSLPDNWDRNPFLFQTYK